MGVLFKINGAKFTAPYIIDTVDTPDEPIVPDEPIIPVTIEDYPVQDTLKGLYDLGTAMVSEDNTVINHAPSASPATATLDADGEPYDMGEGYVTFVGSTTKSRLECGLTTNLSTEGGITVVALFSTPSGSRPIVGNRRATSTAGDADIVGFNLQNDLVQVGDPSLTSTKGVKTIQFDNRVNTANAETFAILTMRATPNGIVVKRYTNGGLTNVLNYEGVVTAWVSSGSTANKIQIGGCTSNGSDTSHISLAAIHEGVVTDEQLTEICAFVKQYGEQKGLTVE